MFEFHGDRRGYFDMQILNAEKYVIPFIEQSGVAVKPGFRVLEIGCGEGGVLKAFVNKGCIGVGVEMDTPRLDNAAIWLKEDIDAGKIKFIDSDIYKVDPERDLGGLFDIIVLKDVIEHIHDQPKLISWMKSFLAPGGTIFFGFPPWQMPFGGHQQICTNKWLSRLPYYHLLPRSIYASILRSKKENVEAFLEIKDTGISIERFERIVKQTGYNVVGKTHFFLNPIYEWKFGWKARKQLGIISALPYIRNFFTTCVYYLIKVK